jgi:hypothetical protein
MTGRVGVIGQRTNTTKVRYGSGKDMYTPGWGNKPGSEETRKALDRRMTEGQKKTPIGRGVAIKGA